MMLHYCALKARLLFASLLTMLALAASPDARADDALKAKIGVLRLSSSAPVFIAQDKAYFREAGLDIELKFFDAARYRRGKTATAIEAAGGVYRAGSGRAGGTLEFACECEVVPHARCHLSPCGRGIGRLRRPFLKRTPKRSFGCVASEMRSG